MLDGKVLYYYLTSVGLTTIHNAEWTALKECRVQSARLQNVGFHLCLGGISYLV